MRVVIIQKSIPHYRIAFFEKLSSHSALRGRELVVVHGNQIVNPSFGMSVRQPMITLKIFRLVFYWQNCLKYLRSTDVFVVEQANKLLFNYILIICKPFFKYKIAIWGHG